MKISVFGPKVDEKPYKKDRKILCRCCGGHDARVRVQSRTGLCSSFNMAVARLLMVILLFAPALSTKYIRKWSEREIISTDHIRQTFYCHHKAACGIRTAPGPATADSPYEDGSCFCVGATFDERCYRGRCQGLDDKDSRDDELIDAQGMCKFHEDISFEIPCQQVDNKMAEDRALNLRFYTDDPPRIREATKQDYNSHREIISVTVKPPDIG